MWMEMDVQTFAVELLMELLVKQRKPLPKYFGQPTALNS
jgi:hypothetical protein